ncbi:hypothetical protein [Stutzerimonas balearica]
MANTCHPVVAEKHANALARYARLSAACDSLEAFMGCRPSADEDVFSSLAHRRSQIADLLARANLEEFEKEAARGLYLTIPYFSRCSDKQPVFLLNRTSQPITYLSRSLYAYASTDEGVDEYRTIGNAFSDGIAADTVIEPGEKLRIDEYSMSFDGDFVSNRRVILLVDGQRGEWLTSISKLAGFLWDEDLHGLHLLKIANSNVQP